MNKKKIAIIIISILALGGIGYFGYKYFMKNSGNAEKDNRKIRLFRNLDFTENDDND
jgi:flagellar basal body-associated protein FliL